MRLRRYAARRPLLAGALVLGASRGPGVAHAAVPAQLTQQGRVLTSAGAPLDGTADVLFALYAEPNASTPVWSELQRIAFDDGYFSTELGSVTPFGAAVWNGSTLYLGITIGSDPEMTPREMLTSVPYAMLAGDVSGDQAPCECRRATGIVRDASP